MSWLVYQQLIGAKGRTSNGARNGQRDAGDGAAKWSNVEARLGQPEAAATCGLLERDAGDRMLELDNPDARAVERLAIWQFV